MMGGEWGLGGMGFGGLGMLLFWGLVILGIVLLVRWLSDAGRHQTGGDPSSRGPTALQILDQRYARGEIDRAEYEEKRRDLHA